MNKVYMRYPGFLTKALTLSYDDGVEQDAQLIDILNRAGIKCTFNLNSGQFYNSPQSFKPGQVHRVLTKDAAIDLYKNSGHEVAVHTLNHPYPSAVTPMFATAQIFEDRKNLEAMFEAEIRGMAYPYGEYNDTWVDIAKNCGIAYSRTTKSTHKFALPSDWLRLETTCHHDDPKLSELTDKFINSPVHDCPLLFYLWGHSFEFEQKNNWHVITDFCNTIGNRDDIWYATNIEIYDYIEAYRALRFTADGSSVFNPACMTVYLYVRNTKENIELLPGQRINL